MKKRMITIGFLSMTALGAVAGEDFYKWVDDKGVTHYSQSTPENMTKDRKVETVNVHTHIPVDSDAAIANLAKQRSDAQKARDDAAAGKSKDKQTEEASAKQKELNKANCVQWKQELELLNGCAKINEMDDKGNTKTLSDDEKKKRLEQTQKNIKQFC